MHLICSSRTRSFSSSPSGSLDRMAGLGILVMAGFSASIAMVLASIATFMDPSFANFEVFQLRGRMKLVLFLLAPLNLHIAGVGLLYVKAASDGRTAEARYAFSAQDARIRELASHYNGFHSPRLRRANPRSDVAPRVFRWRLCCPSRFFKWAHGKCPALSARSSRGHLSA